MENGKLTIISILQVLMSEDVLVVTLWENEVRMPSVFAISSLLKKTLPCDRNYKFY